MKHLEKLGLAMAVAASFLAFAGTASATTVTSSEGPTPTLKLSSTNFKLDGAFITVECSEAALQLKVEAHGSETVTGSVNAMSFALCNYPITPIKKSGTFAVHATAPTGNGTLTSTGMELRVHTSVGECVFTTNAMDIGTITGGTPSSLGLNSAKIPQTGPNFLCGSSGTLTGSYSIATPVTVH